MSFDKNFVTDKILESNFDVIDMEQEENGTLRIKITHDIHPDIPVIISVISEGENEVDDDTMTLQFDGPDQYTDVEAKKVLQEVMDLLIHIVEQSLEESPTPVGDQPESSEEESNGNN